MKRIILTLMLLSIIIMLSNKTCRRVAKKKVSEPTHRVKYTVYNAVVGQCDDTPLITADMSKIDTHKLNNGKLKWIAVSRDLEKLFPMGSKVRVSKAGKFNGIWYVHDRMNKRFTNKIDFLVPSNIKLGKGFAQLLIVKD